jgi:polyisoprenoid-binding protein YceI
MNLRSTYPYLLVAFTAFAVIACQTKTVKPVTPPSTPAPAPVTDTTGAIHYRVDGAASEIHIMVYRGGTMARMGHNHVVSSKSLGGELFLHENLKRSRVDLTLPTGSLIVDDPQSRSSEGEDFAAEVPQDAREGTRRNMLRTEILDGEHYSAISLQSIAVSGTRSHPELTMRVKIKDVARDIPVIAMLQESSRTVTVTGEFAIKQTDFGITPLSIALGALQVVDQLKIKFSIVCRQQQ